MSIRSASAITKCSKYIRVYIALQQKENEKTKDRARYNDQFLVATTQPLPRQHQESKFSKSDAFEKKTVHKSVTARS